MKVIGIDVGPRKGGHVCEDDNLVQGPIKPADLDRYLKSLPLAGCGRRGRSSRCPSSETPQYKGCVEVVAQIAQEPGHPSGDAYDG
jgi:hypothetical protein